MKKIDMHAHYGVWNFPIPYCGDADSLLRLCEKHDVAHAVCSSALAILYDMEEGNAELADVVSRHEQILGYVYVNPNFLAQSVAEMERYLPEEGFVGVKIYTGGYSGVAASAPIFAEMVDEVARYATVMLVHTGSDALRPLAEYAEKHPGLNIIMGHAAAQDSDSAARIASTHPNMYLEFCSSWAGNGKVERAVEICGAGQIVYGSDMDLIDPAFIIGMYEDAAVSEEQRQAIYYNNAAQLLGL